MHTKLLGGRVSAGTDIRMHHNSDWSGMAILAWGGEGAIQLPGWVARTLYNQRRKRRKPKEGR